MTSKNEEKAQYRTTPAAGYFVAGRRIPSVADGDGNRIPQVGHVLWLTPAEAKYELLQGVIEPVEETVKPAPAKAAKAAEARD